MHLRHHPSTEPVAVPLSIDKTSIALGNASPSNSTAESTAISISTIINDCELGDDYYVFVGSMTTSTSTTAHLGAFAPSEVHLFLSVLTHKKNI